MLRNMKRNKITAIKPEDSCCLLNSQINKLRSKFLNTTQVFKPCCMYIKNLHALRNSITGARPGKASTLKSYIEEKQCQSTPWGCRYWIGWMSHRDKNLKVRTECSRKTGSWIFAWGYVWVALEAPRHLLFITLFNSQACVYFLSTWGKHLPGS